MRSRSGRCEHSRRCSRRSPRRVAQLHTIGKQLRRLRRQLRRQCIQGLRHSRSHSFAQHNRRTRSRHRALPRARSRAQRRVLSSLCRSGWSHSSKSLPADLRFNRPRDQQLVGGSRWGCPAQPYLVAHAARGQPGDHLGQLQRRRLRRSRARAPIEQSQPKRSSGSNRRATSRSAPTHSICSTSSTLANNHPTRGYRISRSDGDEIELVKQESCSFTPPHALSRVSRYLGCNQFPPTRRA